VQEKKTQLSVQRRSANLVSSRENRIYMLAGMHDRYNEAESYASKSAATGRKKYKYSQYLIKHHVMKCGGVEI
jgi:hypothetical protein